MPMFTVVSQARRQAGVTLVELLIAMFILSIIVAFGVPSFREATANAAMRGTTMDLVAAINADASGGNGLNKASLTRPLRMLLRTA